MYIGIMYNGHDGIRKKETCDTTFVSSFQK